VAEVPGMRRVRFTTSHPRDFGADIVAAIQSEPKLLQSRASAGAIGIKPGAAEMQRTYTREQYLEKITMIRNAKRPISIYDRYHWGFPGETEADFQELDLVGRGEVRRNISFKYSPRPNTPALKMAIRFRRKRRAADWWRCRNGSGRFRVKRMNG